MNKNLQNQDYIMVKNVNKQFVHEGETLEILKNIDFQVKKGEILCIVGASGCGKSTLLRMIAGIDQNHTGEVIIDGERITTPGKKRGMVFQEHRLFPWMNVEQNVGYVLHGISKKERKTLVKPFLELVGLQGFEKAYPRHLSGGMAQRAGIARALVTQPDVLLLDEPFGALDAFTKISLQKELKKIQKKFQTTMILVTHDIEEAVFLGDSILVLSSRPGKIRKQLSVQLPEPRNRNSEEFLQIRKIIYEEFLGNKTI